MVRLGLEKNVVDQGVYANSIQHFRDAKIALPTFAQLADPSRIPDRVRAALADIDPDSPHPLNLYRVHWYNNDDRSTTGAVPSYLELPKSVTGVDARIVVAVGRNFPMIRAHKVLAAYGCLAPRVVTGQYDPTKHRAIWPSTGNYCRGGVAISRIMGCRGVAVLPEGMSRERFDWLDQWVADPADIVRTPGSESNVKEIYDKCHELDQDPAHVIFNQFCEFGNHLVHYLCTGKALSHVYEHLKMESPNLNLRAFVSSTGSAGTIAAGDYLKEEHGSWTVAMEALECPTLLHNGFGEHNIQGIGDKHVPYIHNVMSTDFVVGVSDQATDAIGVLFVTEAGQAYLRDRKGVDKSVVDRLGIFGFSGIANVLGAIKVAKQQDLGPDDLILTVATDGAEMYGTENCHHVGERYEGNFDSLHAAEVYGQHLAGAATDHVMELSYEDKKRIFNLGYFTWVEQQGVSVEDFVARRDQSYWTGLRSLLSDWDAMIEEFNAETGVLQEL